MDKDSRDVAESKTALPHLIFLHGWGGSVSSFLFLKNTFHDCVLTFADFYGFGKTPKPDKPLEVIDFAYGVIEIMQKIGIESAVFVGHSFGGRVAIELAAKYPDKVKKLVLIDSAGVKPRRGIKYFAKVGLHKILKKFGKGLGGSQDYKALSPIMKATFIKVVNYDQTPLLKKIVAPTAIFWGENDKDTPLYMAKKLKNGIADSALFVFTNCGHFSYLDNSGNFVKILSAFIKE